MGMANMIFQVLHTVAYDSTTTIGVYSSLELANAAVRELHAHANDYHIGHRGESGDLETEDGRLAFSRNDSRVMISAMALDTDLSKMTTEDERRDYWNEVICPDV